MSGPCYPRTPDGRYFVAKNRLWRCTDPKLDAAERRRWVAVLMSARRAVRDADNEPARRRARQRVHEAKTALGERGPVWWDDGAPDESRRAPANSSYAAWWMALGIAQRRSGGG